MTASLEENIPNVKILDLRENKLKTLPDQITGNPVYTLSPEWIY